MRSSRWARILTANATLRQIVGIVALVIGGACSLAWIPAASAQNIPVPRFPASAAETQEVVVEQIYRFQVRQFTPPVRVKVVDRKAAGYSTPEDALVAQCSAMFAGDYDWWRAGWDAAGQKTMANRGADYWKKNWHDLLGNRTFVVSQRAETNGAVIYAYKLDPPAQIEALSEGTMVFRQENGRWVNSNSLAEDPVFLWWMTPGRRGRMIMRK